MKQVLDRTNIDTGVKRQFRFMPTLDLYILKEFLVIYFCLTFAFALLFLVSDLINMLGEFLGIDASWVTIAYYFLLKQPGDIKFVLPISLLLSTIYTMAKFGMNNEITAMRASGVSLLRCGVSIYVIGLIVTGVNFWFNESLVPNCTKEASIVLSAASSPNYLQQMTKMLVYRTPNGNRTWLIKSFVSENEQVGVQMKKYDKGTLELELYAERSKYSSKDGWEFFDVKLVRYEKVFLKDDYSTGTLGDKQAILAPISQKFAIFNKKNKEFSDLGNFFETPIDFLNAQRSPDEWTSSDINSLLGRAEGLSSEKRGYYTTILYTRWAFPWLCILSVLLGIPLAASNERRGAMVSIASAVGVVIFYQVVSQIFMVLGQKAYLPPIIAGLAPTIVLAAYVWYNINKFK